MSRVGGNTPCTEVRVNGHLVILDAGTGIIGLGHRLMQESMANGRRRPGPIVATLLFSHTHHDHTQGFPFFKPAYLGSSTLYIFGPRLFHEDLEEALGRAMLPPSFPIELEEMQSLKVIRNVDESDVIHLIDPVTPPEVRNIYRDEVMNSPEIARISLFKSYAHPKVGVIVYKIEWRGKCLVYATDVESYVDGDARLIAFAEGADLLIHDSQYTQEEYIALPVPKQGWGHSTPEMATSIAKSAGVKRLALFHHDPTHEDDLLFNLEKKAQKEFPGTFLAREGLTVEL